MRGRERDELRLVEEKGREGGKRKEERGKREGGDHTTVLYPIPILSSGCSVSILVHSFRLCGRVLGLRNMVSLVILSSTTLLSPLSSLLPHHPSLLYAYLVTDQVYETLWLRITEHSAETYLEEREKM